MSTSWRDKITFLTPTYEAHDVNGQEQHFYPVSYRKLMELKRIGRPLALSITSLFSDTKNDTKTTIQSFSNDPKDEQSMGGSVTSIEPISVEVLRYREQQREMAIDKLMDALTEEHNILVFAEIVMDSLRDVFPRNPPKDDVLSFMNGDENNPGLDPGTMWQLGHGVVKANRRIFDPLLERLREFTGDLGARAKEALQKTLEERLASKGPSDKSLNPTETKETFSSPTPTTDIGETSKILSSGSSRPESDQSTI